MGTNPKISEGVEHVTREFLMNLAAGGGKPMEQMTPGEARGVLTSAQAGAKVALPPADVSHKSIANDGGQLKLTIVRPAGVATPLPAFMFFHGGGWVIGDFPTHERMIRDLVVASGAAAVYVDYTRSPEASYPVALNQCYEATRWVAAHGKEINIDGSRLAVAGNSAGGNLATATAMLLKSKGGPTLAMQVLLWPVADGSLSTGSYSQFAEHHFLTRNMMKWFWDQYAPDASQRKEGFASPLHATESQLAGLPPTLIQTAEFDVLRDEGNLYARKLDAAGVVVTCTQHNGMIHDFGLLNALAGVPAVQAAMRQAGAELRKHLG